MNINQKESCVACGRHLECIGGKCGVDIFQCIGCGSILADSPEPGADFYEQSYFGDDAYGYKDDSRPTSSTERLDAAGRRRIAAVSRVGKVVEIGAGNGSFVRAAMSAGLDVTGVERSSHMRRVARDVFRVDLLEAVPSLPNTPVVLVLIEVIEHVKDPHSFLRGIFVELGRQPDRILLTTPNAEAARLLGLSWSQIKPPEHIILYTSDGLRSVLEMLGYTKITCNYYHSVFLDFSIRKFGSRSNRKLPILWILSSLLRFGDSVLCKLLPKKFSIGVECSCSR